MKSPNSQIIRHVFGGGWATDHGQIADVSVDQTGRVVVPFLRENRNNYFELDGGTHKIGGTAKMTETQAAGGAEIIGMYDYWKGTGSGSASRKIVIHAGTVVMAADMNGAFANIKTPVTDDTVPSYNTFDDLLIIASIADAPASWDQTTYQALDASAPNFAFSCTHKNRVWAAGVAAAPSTLYYSAHVDPEDWDGAGSGSIQVDPNDGDSITGIASYKNDLWVFKGPYKGSIHRIVGSAPTGSDSFGKPFPFVRGLGAVWHNTIFQFMDDIGFMWSDGSIHSLKATSAYGDFNESAMSRPINTWLRDHITGSRMQYAWAANDSVRGYVLFTIPTATSTTNNVHLLMDYRFSPPRWAKWDAFTSGCLASVSDSGVPSIFSGSNDGFVRRLQQPSRSIDGGGTITSDTVLPYLDYGLPANRKTISRAILGLSPSGGSATATLKWTRDNETTQTQSVDQGGDGALLDEFMLDEDTLAGSTFMNRFLTLEEGGSFRSISLGVENAQANVDLELHSISTLVSRGSDSWEND